MKLESLENEIRETLNYEILEALHNNEDDALATVNTNDGYIDIVVGRKGEMHVSVNHDNEARNCTMTNFEKWVENIAKEYHGLINWLEVELDSLDDVDTSDEAEYFNPGITCRVCKRANEIRRQINILKKANK